MFALLRLCRLPNARVQVVREGGRVDCEKKPQKRKREKLLREKKKEKFFVIFSPQTERKRTRHKESIGRFFRLETSLRDKERKENVPLREE